MVARRKKRTARRKKTFSVNVLDLGAGLAFLDLSNAGTAAQQMLKGDIKSGVQTLSNAFKSNKNAMIAVGAGSLAAKLAVRGIAGSSQFGAIGPLKLRV